MNTRRSQGGAGGGTIYTSSDMDTSCPPASVGRTWWRTIRRTFGSLAGLLLVLSAVVQAAPDQPTASPGASSVPAARFAKNVVVITIDREIDATMARSVERRLK